MIFPTLRNFRTRLLNCGKLLMLPLLIFNVCEVIILILTREPPTEYNRCYREAISKNRTWSQDGGPIRLEEVLLSKVKPPLGKTIFLLETSCSCSDDQFDLLMLTSRQACAVESAALHNPSLEIFVLFACQTYRYRSDPITDAILSYKNVRLRHLNLWHMAEGSPLEHWVKEEQLFRSRYLTNNISDLLRLLCLYRFGGIYIDMDVVVLRSFEKEPLNFVGAESDKYLSNAVLSLEPEGFGHRLAELCLREFQRDYNGDIWGYNGPRNIFNIMTKVCGTSDVNLMQEDRDRCHGMKVFPINAFYEISGGHWTHFFDPKYANATLERLKNSYVTHVWNRITTRRSLRVDSRSAYIQLAAQHCPKVLAATRDHFD